MADFSLNRIFVVCAVFIGTFTALLGFMPTEFLTRQPDYTLPITYDREVVDFFTIHNITLYSNTWQANITLWGDPPIIEDYPEEGHKITVGWVGEWYFGYGPPTSVDVLYVFHSWPSFWQWIGWPDDRHHLELTPPYRVPPGQVIIDAGGATNWKVVDKTRFFHFADDDVTYSRFEMKCSHLSMSLVFTGQNQSKTLEQNWDDGELSFMISYEVDWEGMRPSAWMLIGQLLLFQAPNLGIPGVFGSFLGYVIGLVMWSSIILVVYAAVTRLIPTLRGGVEN